MAKFYASYGSNLNIDQMLTRCPRAKSVTKIFSWVLNVVKSDKTRQK